MGSCLMVSNFLLRVVKFSVAGMMLTILLSACGKGEDENDINEISPEVIVDEPFLIGVSVEDLVEYKALVPIRFSNQGGGSINKCEADGLPVGLSIGVSEDQQSCEIEGLPTREQGAVSYTVTATNESGESSAVISIAIKSQRPFITTWNTANSGITNKSQLQILTKGSANFYVDWGDESRNDNVTGDIIHNYAFPGIYTITIGGLFPRIYFPQNGDVSDATKLLSVEQWGDINWQSMASSFQGARYLVLNAVDQPDLSSVTDMSFMFSGASSLNQELNHWNVSSVVSMSNLFADAESFNQDLSAWDTSSTINMSEMFVAATVFDQNISTWDVLNVQDMSEMFFAATMFDQDLSAWDVESVTNMGGMFRESALSTENYSSLLQSWSNRNLQQEVRFRADARYGNEYQEFRDVLTDVYHWRVVDAGPEFISSQSTTPPKYYEDRLWTGQARSSSEIEHNIFGMHTIMIGPGVERSLNIEAMNLLQEAGYHWVKDVMWCYLDEGDDASDVARKCTREFDGYEKLFFQQLKPRNLEGFIRLDLKYKGRWPTTDVGIEAYKTYVRLAVEKFSPYVKHWELLNEPNLLRNCNTSPRSPSCAPHISSIDYVRLVQEAAAVIKQVDPQAKVHATGLATLQAMYDNYSVPTRWLKYYFAMNGNQVVHTPYDYFREVTPFIDYFSYHPYRTGDERKLPEYGSHFSIKDSQGNRLYIPYLEQIADLKERLSIAAGKEVAISATETGFCLIEDRTVDNASKCLSSDMSQAKYEQRSSILDFVAGNDIRITYLLNKQRGTRDPKIRNFENAYVEGGRYHRKPNYNATKIVHGILDSTMTASKHTCTIDSSNLIQAHMFDRQDPTMESVCIYWAQVEASDDYQPETVDIRISSANFDTPILVDLFTPFGETPTRTYPKFFRDGANLVIQDIELKDSAMALFLVPDYIATLSELEFKQFNLDYYLLSNPDVKTLIDNNGGNGLEHWARVGKQENRNPSPLFDPVYYLQQYAQVRAAIDIGEYQNVYDYFVTVGIDEMKNPNAFFDAEFYQRANVDLQGLSPYKHYILFGAQTGLDPGPGFSEKRYLNTYSDAAVAVKAKRFLSGFFHYMAVGRKEGKKAIP